MHLAEWDVEIFRACVVVLSPIPKYVTTRMFHKFWRSFLALNSIKKKLKKEICEWEHVSTLNNPKRV